MNTDTARQGLQSIEAELASLAGRRNRKTEQGRINHNRASALYRRRKKLEAIVSEGEMQREFRIASAQLRLLDGRCNLITAEGRQNCKRAKELRHRRKELLEIIESAADENTMRVSPQSEAPSVAACIRRPSFWFRQIVADFLALFGCKG